MTHLNIRKHYPKKSDRYCEGCKQVKTNDQKVRTKGWVCKDCRAKSNA